MATIIGYDGSLWLVAVLLVLALGLAGAIVTAVRDRNPSPARDRRPR